MWFCSVMASSSGRIKARFDALAKAGRGGLITFLTAGDPDPETSWRILEGLAGAGADLIELGMPFSDPMADGPAIQAASLRALKSGMTVKGILDMVRRFRQVDATTPIVLMGYFNPIYNHGVDRFLAQAVEIGVDGAIIVDLPPEEDAEFCLPAAAAGLDFIRLATPTTDEERLPKVLKNSSGFVYYVSVAGITGTKSAAADQVTQAVRRLQRHTDLPVAVGFGIKTAAQVGEVTRVAAAAVVGSALVGTLADHLDDDGRARDGLVEAVLDHVRELAAGVTAESP